jgi:hypothetical protein
VFTPSLACFLSLFFCILPLLGQQRPSAPLVDYHFDDEDLASGPDTFRVIQSSKGSVRLSNQYRYSGSRSLEIRSVTGDPDFPELQGYFPRQDHGVLSIQRARSKFPINIIPPQISTMVWHLYKQGKAPPTLIRKEK